MAFAVALATILSLAWMCYRVSVLLKIPIPTLVRLLGLDLPSPPRVSLHGIASDSVTLHWSLPEKANSVAKHIIQINGIIVGDSERRGETSVTVTGLNPDQLYNVRVIAANQHNFQAPGPLIRLRTRRKSIEGAEGNPKLKGERVDDSPSIQSHTPVLEPHVNQQQQQQQQQHHNSHGSKRHGRDRRHTLASADQPQTPPPPNPEDLHTVESLTAELETVRAEIEDLEAQIAHADEEHKTAEGVLNAELELLREKKRSEDAGRHQLRTETRSLEEAKRAAEAQKTKMERLLRTKEDEIRKMKQESAKWEEERQEALTKAERLAKEAEESKVQAENTKKELDVEIIETQAKVAEYEEEIRNILAAMKDLEAERDQLKAEAEKNLSNIAQDEKLDKEWAERQKTLEMRYVSVLTAFNAAQDDYYRSREALAFWKTRRGSAPATDSPPVKRTKQRRNRNRKSRTHTLSNPEQPFGSVSGFPSQVLQPNLFTASNSSMPYFTMPNSSTDDALNDDKLNGSSLMSPTADSLLPSDLFSSVGDPPSPTSRPKNEHRNSMGENLRYLQQSPMSSESPSTSRVSSPRSSFQHMPLFSSPGGEGPSADPDKAITNPLRARGQSVTENVSGTRRFVNLFSFNKPRGKSPLPLPLEAPLLGSLKPAESQSFPKNHSVIPSLDPIGTRRRSGSYGSWNLSSNLNFLNKKNGGDKEHDGVDGESLFDRSEPVSPRPTSMASFEGVLPRPSSGVSAAFGWPAEPHHMPRSSRLSVMSTNWSDFTGSKTDLSATNMSTSSFQIPPMPTAREHPLNASSSQAQPLPRLNPTAPTFESSLLNASQPSLHSLHTENSHGDMSFSTADSASSSVLDMVPTKESLFSRLSLSRKGSTSKFNLSWKKDGAGLFGRGAKKDVAASSSEAGGDDAEALPTPDASGFPPTPGPNSGTPVDGKGIWGKKEGGAASFFSRKKGPASEAGGDQQDESLSSSVEGLPTPVVPQTPLTASSAWGLMKDGSAGFFGRGKNKEEKERTAADGEKEGAVKRISMDVHAAVSSPTKSFFKMGGKEKGKERVVEEAEGA